MPHSANGSDMNLNTIANSVRTFIPNRQPITLFDYYEEFRDYYPLCELQTKRWFVENVRDGWTIFDVGANIGYYSILFSGLCPSGQVIAFEPTKTVLKLLRNFSRHNITNVKVEPVGLSDKTGIREEGVFRIWGRDAERESYTFDTIDNYVATHGIEHVDCIKIDTDSFDFEILRGAENTLARDNPWVVVEVNHALARRGQSAVQAFEWLETHGYHETLVLDLDNFVLKRQAKSLADTGLRLHFDRRPVEEASLIGYGPKNAVPLEAQTHNDATVVLEEDALRIAFDGPCWANVATLPLSNKLVTTHSPGVMVVDVDVSDGILGVGTFNSERNEFVGLERLVPVGRHRVAISLDADSDEVLFRNATEGGKLLAAMIRAVDIVSSGAPALKSRPAYCDHDATSIDIEELRQYWTQASGSDRQHSTPSPALEPHLDADAYARSLHAKASIKSAGSED